MSTTESRPSDNFGLWVVLSTAGVLAAAMFASSREKPPILFAMGFGLVMGLLLRVLALQMTVSLNRRVIVSVVLLAAAGFALSLGLGYRRVAIEWKTLQTTGPDNPLATALLQKFPNSDPSALIAAQQRFEFSDYLSRRVPNWQSPWPEVLCGAEWVLCAGIAGCCAGVSAKKPVVSALPASGSHRTDLGE